MYELQAVPEVISDAGALLPSQHARTEAFVCEAFRGVGQSVLGLFERNEKQLCGRDVGGGVGCQFVRMVKSGSVDKFNTSANDVNRKALLF